MADWPAEVWPVGELADDVKMNREIRDRQNFLGGAVRGCAVYKSTDTTLNLPFVGVSFDTELFDTDSMWTASPNPNRITIPAGYSGRLVVYGCYSVAAATAVTSTTVRMWKNTATTRLVTRNEIRPVPEGGLRLPTTDIARSFFFTVPAIGDEFWEIEPLVSGTTPQTLRGGRANAVMFLLQ